MPDSNKDLEKAAGVISQLMIVLSKHAATPSSMTRADVNYLRGRLDLLEYLITPASGAKIEPLKKPSYQTCFECGTQLTTGYHHQGRWYCPTHFPDGITWPIGMHGDDLKAHKERK